MTDKYKIEIDGVDVSGCCYAILPKNQCPAKIKPYAKETSCIACKEHNIKLNFCKNNPNCYFKQLARKTQECDELKEEYEALKLENQELYTILSDLKEVRKLKDEYVQKCEKLKSQVDEDYNYYTTELKTLRDTISNKEKRNAELFLTCGHYRKALEEIENICVQDRDIKDVCLVSTCFESHRVMYDIQEEILNIINKAKGEGND